MTTNLNLTTGARAALLAVSLLAGGETSAGRPLATEDAGVLESGECEIEAFAARMRARATPSEGSGWAETGCGIGFNTQLAAGLGRLKAEDQSHTNGALSGKTALRPLSDEAWGVSLAYAFGAFKTQQGWRRDTSAIGLVLTVPRGRTLVHANLGVVRKHMDKETAATYALALERLSGQGLDVGVEVYGENRQGPWFGVGARYALLPKKLFIDFSCAQQADNSRTRLVTVGLKSAF